MPRVVLVGEHNPHGADPRYALFPRPERSAGGRLCRILGLTEREYLRRFDRRNLLTGDRETFRWSVPQAREAAGALLRDLPPGDGLVLLGARVAAAFRSQSIAPFQLTSLTFGMSGCPDRWAVLLPHPSGRNPAWNDPTAAPRARAAVLELLLRVEGLDLRWLRVVLRKLAQLLALLRPFPEGEEVVRAGGGLICALCGEAYADHASDPREPWMTLLCDGTRVKL